MSAERPRLFLAANAVPGSGGQGINLTQMVAGLRDSFDVTVFSRGSAPNVRSMLAGGSRLGRIVGGTPYLRRLRGLQTYAEEVAFDRHVARNLGGCEIFQGVTGQCLDSIGVAKRNGALTVLDSITAHVDEFVTVGRRECSRFGIRFPINERLQDRMRREYELADVIRVMSEYARATFLARGIDSSKLIVVEPHYDTGEFPQVQTGRAPFRVCYLGALEPWKGFQYLIEAFNNLDVKDAELELWGGLGTNAVASYVRRTTEQHRNIRQRTVDVRESGFATVFDGASVLVHPSLSDGWGQVVAEAMACGVPVIVTRATGAFSLVRDGENGFLVAQGDAGAIVDPLTSLAKNRYRIDSMGKAARAAVSELTLERFRQKYVPKLKDLLSERKSGSTSGVA